MQEKKLIVEIMRMLRWMCGVVRADKIHIERIRGRVKVVGSILEGARKVTAVVRSRVEERGGLRGSE